MVKLEEIVAPIIVLDDDSDTEMCESGLKLNDINRDKDFDAKKNGDGKESAAPTIDKQGVEAGTVIHSTAGGDDGNSSMVTNGGPSVLVNVIGDKVNSCGSLDGFFEIDKNITEGEHPCMKNGKDNVGDCNKLNGNGKGGSDVPNSEAGEHGFRVGDIVWCKSQKHPWWPGQVYDIKDASEFALKYTLEGKRLLVAYYGDGACSWVLQSQLIPFVENFAKKSIECDSKIFQNAVQKAVDDISRIIESEKVCRCIPEAERGGLARPVAENAGIKAGVLVPEVHVHRLSFREYEPYEVLEKVRHFANDVSVGSTLDLAVLKSWLSAFNRFRFGHQLPSYNEPTYIDGLEERNENSNAIEDDLNVPIKFLISSPVVGTRKSKGYSKDIVYHKKKWKTIGELMNETTKLEPESQETMSVKKKCKKRKAEVCENVSKVETSDVGAVDGMNRDSLDNVFTPRERKKSKYLSPPYTNVFGRARSSCSLNKSLSKCVGKASEENIHNGQLEMFDTSVNTKLPFCVSDVELPVDDFLSKIQFAAVKPLCLSSEGSSDMVLAFVSALRSSTYVQGSNYETFRNYITAEKKKTDSSNSEDDFVSDARAVTRKLEIMTAILGENQNKFSVEEKSRLKEDIKQIMESAESFSEKVLTASEKVTNAEG